MLWQAPLPTKPSVESRINSSACSSSSYIGRRYLPGGLPTSLFHWQMAKIATHCAASEELIHPLLSSTPFLNSYPL